MHQDSDKFRIVIFIDEVSTNRNVIITIWSSPAIKWEINLASCKRNLMLDFIQYPLLDCAVSGWKDRSNLRSARKKKLSKARIFNKCKAQAAGNDCVNQILLIPKVIEWRRKKTTCNKPYLSWKLNLHLRWGTCDEAELSSLLVIPWTFLNRPRLTTSIWH
jgi:hypothetical protein